jgi:hypothetical protein
MAPELFGKQGSPVRPTKQSDIYSFGGIMLLVCTEALTRRAGMLTRLLGPHRENSLSLCLIWASHHLDQIMLREARKSSL